MEIWLKEGDKNTKLFHKMANAHGKRNFLSKVRANGGWLFGRGPDKERCNSILS